MNTLHCEQLSQVASNKKSEADPKPAIVFLHGFLGDSSEWHFIKHSGTNTCTNTCTSLAKNYSCYALDLPGHGLSADITLASDCFTDLTCEEGNIESPLLLPCAAGFVQTSELIQQTLNAEKISSYHLVGYSLGARIALFHSLYQEYLYQEGLYQQDRQSTNQKFTNQAQPPKLQSLTLESGNFGLTGQMERDVRFDNDKKWADIFTGHSAEAALELWYQQPIFASLTNQQRHQLIDKRKKLNSTSIAQMLLATSLANQVDFSQLLKNSQIPCHYFYGEKDQKFKALAKNYQQQCPNLQITSFADAGHNIHFEQPQAYLHALAQRLNSTETKR